MTEYPQQQKFWQGDAFVSLGSGIYHKKVAFVSLQIYTVAVYVEQGKGVARVKKLQQQGFFQNGSTDKVCSLINEPGFKKVLHIRLLRDVSTGRFISEMVKDLGPRCARTGSQASMKQFTDYLQDKQVKKGGSLVALWDEADTLAGGMYPPGFNDWANAQPVLGVRDVGFCRAMFDMYLDSQSVVPDTRKVWSKNILGLASS